MLPHPALLLMIPAPSLIALLFRTRASWVMGAGLLGTIGYTIIAMTRPMDIPEAYAETHYLTGSIAFLHGFVIVTFLLLVAQVVKERLGREDRLTTLTLFLLNLIGGAISLLPLTTQPPSTEGWRNALANVGGYLFIAGLIGLAFVIMIRPLIRRLRRSA